LSCTSCIKDEIKREDDIVYQRSMSSLTFQGFLFASMTFLVSNPWFKDVVVPIHPFRESMLAFLGIAGFIVALLTASGIMAAASSIAAVSKVYNEGSIPKNPLWPQLHGKGRRFKLGGGHAVALHFLLAILWGVYEVVLVQSLHLLLESLVLPLAILLSALILSAYLATRSYLSKD
jgi:hypothetical protein